MKREIKLVCRICGFEAVNKKALSNHLRYGCPSIIVFTNIRCKYCDNFLPKRKPSEQGKFCNQDCYSKWRKNKKRGAYKESVIISGYRYLYMPNHPYCSHHNYVAEHRFIMETQIGRYLINDEIVHHINEDKLDNKIENLQLMTISEHLKYHKSKLIRNENGQFTI